MEKILVGEGKGVGRWGCIFLTRGRSILATYSVSSNVVFYILALGAECAA